MTQNAKTAGQKDAEPNTGYIAFHMPRFVFLVDILRPYINSSTGTILDIGRSYLTTLLARELRIGVDSLGLEADEQLPSGRHVCFDLNDSQYRDRWPSRLGPYPIIVFAEVIEHLYTPPEFALSFLRQLLEPGGLIVVQTPNAVSLGKRLKMALGRNPFEQIRGDRSNPGHYREYTMDELIALLGRAGLSVKQTYRQYYFDARFARHTLGNEQPTPIRGAVKNVLYRSLPPSMREGIAIVACRI